MDIEENIKKMINEILTLFYSEGNADIEDIITFKEELKTIIRRNLINVLLSHNTKEELDD